MSPEWVGALIHEGLAREAGRTAPAFNGLPLAQRQMYAGIGRRVLEAVQGELIRLAAQRHIRFNLRAPTRERLGISMDGQRARNG